MLPIKLSAAQSGMDTTFPTIWKRKSNTNLNNFLRIFWKRHQIPSTILSVAIFLINIKSLGRNPSIIPFNLSYISAIIVSLTILIYSEMPSETAVAISKIKDGISWI